MKQLITILLCVWVALPSFGAVSVQPTLPIPSNVRYVTTGMSYEAITNMVGSATAGTLIHFAPGTYYIPTNTTSWLKVSGVNFWFDPGTKVVFGHVTDGTQRLLFDDLNVATTNYIYGAADFVVSNRFSSLIRISNSATIVTFQCNSADRSTNSNNSLSLVYQEKGTLNLTAYDLLAHRGYDVVWCQPSGSSIKCNVRAGRIIAADSALEINTGALPGNIDLTIGQIESDTGSDGGALVNLIGNCTVTAGGINLFRNSYCVLAGTVGTDLPTITCRQIKCDPTNANSALIASGSGRLVGCLVTGPTNNFPIDMTASGLILESCETVTSKLSSTHTNSIHSFDGSVYTVSMRSGKIDKPIDPILRFDFDSMWATNSHAQTLTADNASVNTTNVSYIRLSSDNVTAANRTFVLTPGLYRGQTLSLEWVGTNAGELVDDSAQTTSGNHRLAGTWTPTQYDVLYLEFNGLDWVERSRATN